MLAIVKPPANLADWLGSAAVLAAALAAFLVLRHLALGSLRRAIKDPHSTALIALDSLQVPSALWAIAAGLLVTLQFAELPGAATRWVSGGAVVFLVLSICGVTSSLLVRLAVVTASRRGVRFAASGVSKALIHVFVLLLGGTVLLRYFNITVAPLLTALGVGGLAVALALRDTLANFFAGIHIVVEAPISIGDFIQLSSGEEGTVTDIGWRTTRVLTTSNNIIVIPNEKITSSILTNYALPEPPQMAEVIVSTALSVDVQRVVAICVETAAATEGVLPDFEPLVICDPGVLPTHLQMKLIVRVADRLQRGMVQSRVRFALLERFRQEGIALPVIEQVAVFKA